MLCSFHRRYGRVGIVCILITLNAALGSLRAQEVVFLLPTVPDSLQEPQQRLSYVLDHYWENYVWNDTTDLNQMVGEQGLVDFLDLLQYADSLTADRSAAQFVTQAFAADGLRARYAELLDHYLYDRHSPVRNDRVYAHLLRHLATPAATPDETERQRLLFRLLNVSKNQVGAIATDFVYRDDRGKKQRLLAPSGMEKQSEGLTLLMFYDPHCEECHVAEARMKREPALQDHRLNIIRMEADKVRDRYFIRFTPTFYLLDAYKRVLLKDASLEQVLQTLSPENTTKNL